MKANDSFYKTILEEELSRRAEVNPRYSLRAMARALGIEPGALSEILSGKRVPSYKMAQKVLAALELSPETQTQFLESLAQTHRRRGLERINPIFRKLRANRPKPKDLSIELFRIIGDWYHYAILMLTYVEGFVAKPRWIATQLNISELDAKLAVQRLIAVGLLKEENDTLICWSDHFTTADKHLTTAALKRRQKQVLEKSTYSLENEPIEKRSHTAMTMAIDPKKLPEAKKLIEEFTNKMSELLECDDRSKVYEFHVGLFPLQK